MSSNKILFSDEEFLVLKKIWTHRRLLGWYNYNSFTGMFTCIICEKFSNKCSNLLVQHAKEIHIKKYMPFI